MPGPQRQPNAIKKLRGNPGKRSLPEHEPKPKLVLPPPPRGLDHVARAEWKRAAKILRGVGVLTEADLAMLKGYCVNFSYADACEARVQKDGITIIEWRGPKDNRYSIERENPAFTAGLKARRQMFEFANALGLSPTSRTKIQSAPEVTRSPLEAITTAAPGDRGREAMSQSRAVVHGSGRSNGARPPPPFGL